MNERKKEREKKKREREEEKKRESIYSGEPVGIHVFPEGLLLPSQPSFVSLQEASV